MEEITFKIKRVTLTFNTKCIKNNCVSCNRFIVYDIERYKVHGNYCKRCNTLANKKSRLDEYKLNLIRKYL